MRKWIVGTLAVIGALSLVVVLAAAGFGYWSYRQLQAPESLPASMVLAIDLREPIVETVDESPWQVLDPSPPMAVSDIVRTLDLASKDARIQGLFARISETGHGMAVAQELRDAIGRFRRSGRFAIVWADSLGELAPANEGYYLATAFDEIYLQPGSFVGLTGMLIEVPFIRGLLGRLGVEMEVVRSGGYKTALDFLTQRDLTPQNREMLGAMLDSLFGRMVQDVATARHLDEEQLRGLIDQGPLTAEAALDAGLIDGTSYLDEVVEQVLDRTAPDTGIIMARHYASAVSPSPTDDATVIALVSASGPVQRGEGDLSSSIHADELASAIADAREDEEVEGVLLRLDTPGGSAVASETIAREVRLSRQQGKPVVVSMGNTAASGGYWIAMGADRIVAQPATLTGSIGVIAGKPNLEEMWDHLDVDWAGLKRGDNADMWSLNAPFGPTAQAKLEASVDYLYGRFKEGVAEGRDLDIEEVEALAQGRVWTGSDAFERGLVDQLGGLHEAQAVMRDLLRLDADAELDLLRFPPPRGAFDTLSELWNLQISAAQTLWTMQTWLGAASAWLELAGPRVSFVN